MELVKKIASIVIGGAVALGVIVSAISWFQMTPDERSAILGTVGSALAWLGIVLVLPWATYFLTTAIARRESNAAGAGLVFAYTVLDAGILVLLSGGFVPTSTMMTVVISLGLLIALAYNLLACDWIAERLT